MQELLCLTWFSNGSQASAPTGRLQVGQVPAADSHSLLLAPDKPEMGSLEGKAPCVVIGKVGSFRYRCVTPPHQMAASRAS